MGQERSGGVTLVELLVVLMIGAVLLSQAGPSWRRMLVAMQGETLITRVHRAVQFARSQAVHYGSPAVLCPLARSGRCDGDWSRAFSVFLDLDSDARRDESEPVLRRFEGPLDGQRLQFGAFRTSRYLRFLPNGATAWQNGTFIWCPPVGLEMMPQALVVNVQGRARRARGPRAGKPCGKAHSGW